MPALRGIDGKVQNDRYDIYIYKMSTAKFKVSVEFSSILLADIQIILL